MTFQHKVLEQAGETIILATMNEDFKVSQHTNAAAQELMELLDSFEEPVYYVNDARDIQIDLDDLLTTLAQTTRGDMAVFRHPNIREIVVVTASFIATMGARALGQTHYAGKPVAIFDSLEDAWEYIEGKVGD